MGRSEEIEQFAAYLRMLKDRTGRSFDALGKRAGVSGSSLHRYCAGTSVPPDYGVIQAFAKVCGATRQELRELHRLWALADARRDALPAGGAESTLDEPQDTGAGAGTTEPALTAGVVAGVNHVSPVAAARPALPARRRPRRTAVLVAVAVVGITALLGGAVWMMSPLGDAEATPLARDGLLFSPACRSTVAMGQHDECVREVQTLLQEAGTKIGIDGDFGPETLKRVTAFQVLAGLPANGVVDDATKERLYQKKVSMATWPAAKVEQRVREVFTENPDYAVAIAKCQSFLDPLWVLPNVNGSRNWGVFQLSDTLLQKYGGTPLRAFDPEWNIQTAHQVWAVNRDFQNWKACDQAARKTASPTATAASPAASTGS